MANGYPKYGGTNGVPVLDIGQAGGVRAGANLALFTGQMIPGPDGARTVEYAGAQAGESFQENLGRTPATHTLRGTIKAASTAALDAIRVELDSFLHGHLKDSGGRLIAADTTRLKETQLTDSNGSVLAARARLTAWRFTERRRTTPEGKVVVPIEMEFRAL